MTTESAQPVSKVIVHPLVLLSVVDHYTRMHKIGSKKRVVGVLLGSWQSKGVLDISNSYAVPFEEDEKDKSVWFLDHDYLENKYHMFKKTKTKERTWLYIQVQYVKLPPTVTTKIHFSPSWKAVEAILQIHNPETIKTSNIKADFKLNISAASLELLKEGLNGTKDKITKMTRDKLTFFGIYPPLNPLTHNPYTARTLGIKCKSQHTPDESP